VRTNERNVTLENVTIAFRNFAGKEDKYNREGDRNFSVLLDEESAAQLVAKGWNVKRLNPRDEEEIGTPYLQIAVSYKVKPPKIGVLTSKGLRNYTEDMVELLDWVDIAKADVSINPYEWVVGGKSGIKAYLNSLYMQIEEDYLQLKWQAIAEESVKQIDYSSTENDIVDAEFYEVRGEIEAAQR